MPEPLVAAVADEIKRLIADRGMSVNALAKATGLSQSSLDRKIKGSTPFDVGDLATVARALHVEPAEIIEWASAT